MVLLVLLFFTNAGDVFALPTIAIASVPNPLIVNQQFSLTATVSGLVANSNYYAKIRIGTTSATLTKSQTFNALNSPPDDWLSDSDSWTKFPQITSDSVGSWTGVLIGRPSDSAISGQNNLTVRVRKVGSSTNYDSAAVQITVNPSPPQIVILPLSINYSLPASISADTPFSLPIIVNNASPGAKYFFKGVSEESVSTFNSETSSWLAWNGSWTDMPYLTTDPFGSASAILQARFNLATTVLGLNDFLVRIRREGTQNNIDASPSAIFVNAAPPTPAPILPLEINFSTPATVSADTAFDINLRIQNAAPGAQYLAKMVGDGLTTYNGQSYLAWNASWTSMPIISTDMFGAAVATISARFNSSSATPGAQFIYMRIRLAGSENNLDSSQQEIMVNFNPAATILNPSFDFYVSEKLFVNEPFAINLKLDHLATGSSYFVKSRLDGHGLTQNDVWLAETDAWAKFPQITTDANGHWEGIITSKLSSSQAAGEFPLQIRIRKLDDDENIDSGEKIIRFSGIPEPDVNKPLDIVITITSEIAPTLVPKPEVLAATTSPQDVETEPNSLPNGDPLISWGMTILGSAFSSIFLKRRALAV